ncbi:hypothetical protein niasHT_038204 [Heterodera trifolii]|uniref:Uncharacterized protein n=1 Tax=Heterodera trifolii TaxID=157864 RepID=A0ABD2IV32_9BILA
MENSAKYGNRANLIRALNALTNEIHQNDKCQLSEAIHKNYISEANKKNNKFNALNSHFMYDLEKINKISSAQLTLLPPAIIWINQLRTDFATFVPEIGLMDIWQNIGTYTKTRESVVKLCEKIATIQTDIFNNGSIFVNDIISEAKDKLEDIRRKRVADDDDHPFTSKAAGEIKQIVVKMILFAKVAIYRQELKVKVALYRQELVAKQANVNAIGIQNEDIIGTSNILRNRFAEIQYLSKFYNGNEVSHADGASSSQQKSDTEENRKPQKQNSLLNDGIKQFARAGTLVVNALRMSDQFEPKISMSKLFDTETKEEDERSKKELDFVNILKEKEARLNRLIETTKFMAKQFEKMAKDSDNTDGGKLHEFVVNAKNMRAKIRRGKLQGP